MIHLCSLLVGTLLCGGSDLVRDEAAAAAWHPPHAAAIGPGLPSLGTVAAAAARAVRERWEAHRAERESGTPASTPAGTPAAPLHSECATPRPEWIWCDDFEEDRLHRYYEYDDRNGGFVRAAGAGVGGSTGMRARWTRAGQKEAGNLKVAFGRTPHPRFRAVDDGTARYREIYWRMWVRKGDDWEGGGADKLSRATSMASAGYAQAMIAHVWSGRGSRDAFLVIDPASGTDAGGRLRSTRYNDFSNLRWLGAVQGSTPVFSPAHRGRWQCVEARVRLNDPGSSNGSFTLWIDDRLDASRDGLNWVGRYDAYGINAVFFENYWNDGAPRPQERTIDNLVVSTARIGC
jgi:hypothetical protein